MSPTQGEGVGRWVGVGWVLSFFRKIVMSEHAKRSGKRFAPNLEPQKAPRADNRCTIISMPRGVQIRGLRHISLLRIQTSTHQNWKRFVPNLEPQKAPRADNRCTIISAPRGVRIRHFLANAMPEKNKNCKDHDIGGGGHPCTAQGCPWLRYLRLPARPPPAARRARPPTQN